MFNLLDNKTIYRLSILSFLIIFLGISFDMQWHKIHPIRLDYFIIPHLVIYAGIIGVMLTFLILKLRKFDIPIYAFVIFPILSCFDQLWHTVYGVEAYTSPL